ncbi:enolase C-terminal domain-like protein [Aurantimonas sp. C2-6-R+9]|nr:MULTISPECIES: enolase C-terminal domain-like protein [unclassified Aurantimonas]MEC5293417.1 enolase C-terminal domain-like protein [Aurantimonas sp. C2-3-R2]MEC5383578.1 enolase C-terminal domain-like protein [Aurantimonas sp. C2-6-R+9]MEC5414498.1 enolase C-terminal domain-like protein [Aurantimonas sp. C2-4-R8]
MRIIDVRERAIPLQANITNAVVNFAEHTVSLVAVVSDVMREGKPVIGFAFDSIGRFGQSGLLRERLIPRLMAAAPQDILDGEGKLFDADKVLRVVMRNEKPGGHGDRAHAAAALELAIWDLNAKLLGIPAWRLIAEHFGITPRTAMPVYAAGGYYYPTDSHGRLKDEMRRYRDLGYTQFKMKIGGADVAEDMARIEAAVAVVGDPAHLAVDANGRFDLETALAYGFAMRDFGLRWYEEPGDPADYALMARLAENYPHRLATGSPPARTSFPNATCAISSSLAACVQGTTCSRWIPACLTGLASFAVWSPPWRRTAFPGVTCIRMAATCSLCTSSLAWGWVARKAIPASSHRLVAIVPAAASRAARSHRQMRSASALRRSPTSIRTCKSSRAPEHISRCLKPVMA